MVGLVDDLVVASRSCKVELFLSFPRIFLGGTYRVGLLLELFLGCLVNRTRACRGKSVPSAPRIVEEGLFWLRPLELVVSGWVGHLGGTGKWRNMSGSRRTMTGGRRIIWLPTN